MTPYIDLHSHKQLSSDYLTAIYNLLLHESTEVPERAYSAGLHPWYADRLSLQALSEMLLHHANQANLAALGETGLDKVCKVPFQLQLDVLEVHLKIGAEQGIPLVIHCVKAWDELIEITSKYNIIKVLHGYNGSLQLTKRLLAKGFQFSIGKAILDAASKIQESIRIIPLTSVFCETDTSDLPIQSIYEGLGDAVGVEKEELKSIVFENFIRLRDSRQRGLDR